VGQPGDDKPANEEVKKEGNSVNTLQPIANSALVKNSCKYPVYLSSIGPAHVSCEGTPTQGKVIDSGETYVEALRLCPQGGISLKISRTADGLKPMQFEYAVWQANTTLVSYDISYLDCMKNNVGEKDLSECPGHDGGIHAMGGGDHAPSYKCPANLWCDKQAYVVAEFGYQPGAPVGTCAVKEGIAFELCGDEYEQV
jgi:hypothetical protein